MLLLFLLTVIIQCKLRNNVVVIPTYCNFFFLTAEHVQYVAIRSSSNRRALINRSNNVVRVKDAALREIFL